MNIIGMSAGYHDSACGILRDGKLVAAVQEERFSRVKNDRAFPYQSFRFCLNAAGLTIADLDCVAYYEDPHLKLGRQIWMALTPNLSQERRESILDRITVPHPEHFIRRICGYNGPIQIVDHHLSHAASCYYFSGFNEAAIFTVDGVGDWPTMTYGFGKGPVLQRFSEVHFPNSLGFFYSAITAYLGFEVDEGEYKVMGLAPYGVPRFVDKLRKLIERRPEGQFELDMNYFAFLTEDCMYSEELIALLGQPARGAKEELSQFHMDVARSAQVVHEECMLEAIRYLHSKAPSDNLCMAGGVALNVVANSRCLKEGPFKHLFVQPAAGDAGGALGAAAMAHVKLTGEAPEKKRLEHVYLGPSTLPDNVFRLLSASSAKFEDFRNDEDALIQYAVNCLVDGKVLAWFQGRLEFGPRSLGARSILADPRAGAMRERINRLVKKREAFRPFAPAVLESKYRQHFDVDHSSPFMLETCQVISNLDLPAVTHVDGSARIQTVSPDTNRRFAALLQAFEVRTGCPILLNTSFNMRGEPIVCSAADAIVCFVRCGIDVLVIEDFILEAANIPATWHLQAQLRDSWSDGNTRLRPLVYTLV